MISTSLRGSLSKVSSISFRSLSSAIAYPDYILQAPETKVATLNNGLKVATETRGGGLVNLSVAVGVGSRFENESTNGISFLIKELGFTENSKEIGALGGRFSSEVDRESIIFKATVLPSDVKPAMKILTDAACLKSSSLKNLDSAKGSVLCKIAGSKMRPEEHVMEHLYDAAFLGSSMGLPILGTEKSLAAISESDVSEFINKNILGSRIVVSGAGEVKHEEILEACQSNLGEMVGSKVGEVDFPLEECPFVGSDKRIRYDNKPLAHVALAFKGPSYSSEYYFPSKLAMSIMGKYEGVGNGENSSSRWHISLAEHTNTVSAETFSIGYKDTGLIGFKAIANDSSLENLMWYTMESFMRICYKVTDEEVLRTKIAYKAELMKNSASNFGACDEISSQISQFGRRIHPSEIFARIDGITTEQVRESAYRFIHDQDHALSAVGPIYELPDYNWIRRRSYWLRY